jgi:hypothetical protein
MVVCCRVADRKDILYLQKTVCKSTQRFFGHAGVWHWSKTVKRGIAFLRLVLSVLVVPPNVRYFYLMMWDSKESPVHNQCTGGLQQDLQQISGSILYFLCMLLHSSPHCPSLRACNCPRVDTDWAHHYSLRISEFAGVGAKYMNLSVSNKDTCVIHTVICIWKCLWFWTYHMIPSLDNNDIYKYESSSAICIWKTCMQIQWLTSASSTKRELHKKSWLQQNTSIVLKLWLQNILILHGSLQIDVLSERERERERDYKEAESWRISHCLFWMID